MTHVRSPLLSIAARVLASLAMVTLGILAVSDGTPAGAASAPSLQMTSGPYHNGQTISVSVGPNRFFTPYSHVNILECADPKGKAKNLPTSVYSCDGNTIQGNTILVKKNGSFSERGYALYALPNVTQLGEPLDSKPVCNQKHSCVLYVGQNQEKFTAPKVFSHPFVIKPAGKGS
jgi:hypothetical protein